MNRMKLLFPEEYDFHPTSFVIPKEIEKLDTFVEANPLSTFIVKPPNFCEGALQTASD